MPSSRAPRASAAGAWWSRDGRRGFSRRRDCWKSVMILQRVEAAECRGLVASDSKATRVRRRASALRQGRSAGWSRGRDRSPRNFGSFGERVGQLGGGFGLRATRMGSVSRPFSSTQALKGDSDGPVCRRSVCTSLVDERLAAQDDAAEAAALAVDMLGRRIDDEVGAERQRASARSASRTRCRRSAARRRMGDLRDGGDIDAAPASGWSASRGSRPWCSAASPSRHWSRSRPSTSVEEMP